MITSRMVIQCGWAMTIVIVIAGCGSSDYPLAPVSGTVTLDGEPLAGGVVNFQPRTGGQTENPGPGSTARCDEAGQFVLETTRGEPGAIVGKHRVRIYSYSAEADEVKDDRDTGENKERVPMWYNYQSRLEFEVTADGSESADFALTTEPASEADAE